MNEISLILNNYRVIIILDLKIVYIFLSHSNLHSMCAFFSLILHVTCTCVLFLFLSFLSPSLSFTASQSYMALTTDVFCSSVNVN